MGGTAALVVWLIQHHFANVHLQYFGSVVIVAVPIYLQVKGLDGAKLPLFHYV
jgi:hypothetical protein